ncbi:MAG: hypothetical protein ACI9C4_002448 [Paraglaciecola sp.]|jgi:hypothetical protein
MHHDAQRFLTDYAQALDSQNVEQLTNFCLLPTVVMNDQQKILFKDREKLIKVHGSLIEQLVEAKVAKNTPKLSQVIRLSDTLCFIKMRWLFLDKNDGLLFSCPASYTLKRMGDNNFSIIVAVVDPDKNVKLSLFSPTKG